MPSTNILFVGSGGTSARQLASAAAGIPGWQLNRTADPASVRDIVEQRNVAVVVADYSEDPVACTELFRDLLERCPGVIRLALLPPEKVGESIELFALSAHQSMTADRSEDALRLILARAVSVHRTLIERPHLETVLSKLNTIPTPPALYFDLREAIDAPDADATTIARLIARDAALAARILRMVNSGFFALPCTIADLDHAVALLGTQIVLDLVLSVHLYRNQPKPPPGVSIDALWRHAFAVSTLARHVAGELGGDRDAVSASGLSGLLHDVGILMLLANFPGSYPALIREAAGDEQSLCRLEREFVGADHAELGGIVLDLWCLPSAVVSAVAEHQASADYAAGASGVSSQAVMFAEWLVNRYAQNDGILPAEDEIACPYPLEYQRCAAWWEYFADVMRRASP